MRKPSSRKKKEKKKNNQILIVIITLVVTITTTATRPFDTVFSNGDFDALQSETLAELCAFDHTRELLRRKYLERIGEDGRQDRGRAMVDDWGTVGGIR